MESGPLDDQGSRLIQRKYKKKQTEYTLLKIMIKDTG